MESYSNLGCKAERDLKKPASPWLRSKQGQFRLTCLRPHELISISVRPNFGLKDSKNGESMVFHILSVTDCQPCFKKSSFLACIWLASSSSLLLILTSHLDIGWQLLSSRSFFDKASQIALHESVTVLCFPCSNCFCNPALSFFLIYQHTDNKNNNNCPVLDKRAGQNIPSHGARYRANVCLCYLQSRFLFIYPKTVLALLEMKFNGS